MKRLFDVVLSLLGLIVLSPVLTALALTIKLTSPGPVYYRGLRVGRRGRPFHILKFRTMVANAEQLGGTSTANGDARVTPIGRVLRRYKLDELPQLINVLRGEMSFVGPRPEVQEYVDLYTTAEMPILELRPGITDWASIWNSDEGAILAGAADPDRAYLEFIRPTKLKLQLLYAERHTLWIDCKILWYTASKLVRKDWLPKELAEYGRPTPPTATSAGRAAA
jgi:lipopolysaccharide/colanic/teichoic acid biosynthesis glycosyltransferase